MKTTSLPKNKSISVRVNENEENEFETLAKKNQTNKSDWARNILINHKNNYAKVEHINPVLYALEVAIKSFEFIDNELVPANTPIDALSERNLELMLRKGEIRSEIRKLEAIKKRIKN